jgi:hypothetical protein
MNGVLDQVDDFLDRSLGFRGVYNSQNRHIGYFDDYPSLAAGKMILFEGEQPITAADIRTLQLKPDGMFVNMTQYLISKRYSPAWLTPEEKAAIPTPAAFDVLNPSAIIAGNPNVVYAAAGLGALLLLMALRR